MGRKRSGICACHLTAIIGWLALSLGIGLVILHFYVVGIPFVEAKPEASPSAGLRQGRTGSEDNGSSGPRHTAQRAAATGAATAHAASELDRLRKRGALVQPAHGRQPHGGTGEDARAAQRGPDGEAPAGGPPLTREASLQEWESSDENNAKFPGPRPGDTEERSLVPDILPGASPEHMHGLLGRNADGKERILPTPLPPGGMTNDDRKDAHRGFCFNSRVSDSVSVDRPQADYRSAACKSKHEQHPTDLPTTSVVIVFHNENFSILVRSIHSVLNHSPPHLLKEIIVVDDASVAVDDRFYEKHWKRLQEELRDHLMLLPKTTLVRVKERRGLMVARMEGIWRASAEVTVFLDSHVEATPGYLEAMLARVKETDGKSVVVPSIDSIGNEDFTYRSGGGLGVLGFSWTLGQMPGDADNGPDGTRPARSPVMAGGLLASDRKWFLKLGGYDLEMRLYGGEEMEIGFRTWMCGGAIEYVPCSHVGHVFRTPAYWQGQVYKVPGEEISRNKLRTAKVWMDEYSKLVEYATSALPESLPIGDLEPRHELRRKLQCKDAKGGCLQNKVKGACIDTLGQKESGAELGGYPCHFQHGTQALVLDSDGLVLLPQTGYKECMALQGTDKVIQTRCTKSPDQLWSWDSNTGHFTSRSTNGCLTFVDKPTSKSSYALAVEACAPGLVKEQLWAWG
mmetsp:Transcript_1135/g.4716  ORF Transcript_1135/g.4716 Transcript_1135/m.4716 type:complete len:683 (+) Transcript_1135:112-2160(+)